MPVPHANGAARPSNRSNTVNYGSSALFQFKADMKDSGGRVWNTIFKDTSWTDEIIKLDVMGGSPLPCLVGGGLKSLYYGKSAKAYLVLFVSDWGGDSFYLKEQFFLSLQDHEYDAEKHEIRFHNSNLVLHIADAIGVTDEGWVMMTDPRKLFHGRRRNNPHTYALYLHDDNLVSIASDAVGGIEKAGKKNISQICSVRLKFREGNPAYRVLGRIDRSRKAVGILEKDEHGREWTRTWGPPRPGDRDARHTRRGDREWIV
ncbi:hypothetical protein CSUB01_08513 [Colletotrichum sublineola]|uniref:Uncharacterized protein n=1 Tax=Colletotrichum sublineola TaxID=1173701 RepID=A0A066X1A8_COLSU|nr:hypothetical protein CSUB01_08513 [Colletotrichum sublineola]